MCPDLDEPVETPRAVKLGSKPGGVKYDANDYRISHHFRAFA
jgi:hypothetical protein